MQLDTPQKLDFKVLPYLVIKSIIGALFMSVFIGVWLSAFDRSFDWYVLIAGVLLLVVVERVLWWYLFEYTLSADHVSTRSGVIVRHSKTVNYNDLQSMHASVGPLLGIFGLRDVKFFTSSPGQIFITSGGQGGARTEHRPDVHIILNKQVADEFVKLARAADIQKVQIVTPA